MLFEVREGGSWGSRTRDRQSPHISALTFLHRAPGSSSHPFLWEDNLLTLGEDGRQMATFTLGLVFAGNGSCGWGYGIYRGFGQQPHIQQPRGRC